MHVVEGELDRTELALLVKCKIALKSEAFFSRKKGILAMQRKEEVVKKRNYFLRCININLGYTTSKV